MQYLTKRVEYLLKGRISNISATDVHRSSQEIFDFLKTVFFCVILWINIKARIFYLKYIYLIFQTQMYTEVHGKYLIF